MYADLQHPHVHERFGLEKQMGLTDILVGGIDWQEVTADEDGLLIISSGSALQAPESLLDSDKMPDLLQRLQRKSDVVIVDVPPVFLVDTQLLVSMVGWASLVIQQEVISIAVAQSMKEQLDLMDVTLLSAVMDLVPRSQPRYDEGYYADSQTEKPEGKPEAP